MKENKNNKIGLDLTKESPRSPRVRLDHFVILARTIDKCRALIWGNIGEYDFDCELDKRLLDWKGISGDELKACVSLGHSDDEIVAWIKAEGVPKSDPEIMKWSSEMSVYKYDDDKEGKDWLEAQLKRLHLKEESTLVDYLDADDRVSFKK